MNFANVTIATFGQRVMYSLIFFLGRNKNYAPMNIFENIWLGNSKKPTREKAYFFLLDLNAFKSKRKKVSLFSSGLF